MSLRSIFRLKRHCPMAKCFLIGKIGHCTFSAGLTWPIFERTLDDDTTRSHMKGTRARTSQSRKRAPSANKCYALHHWSLDTNYSLVVCKPLAAVQEHVKVTTVGKVSRVGYKNSNPQYDNEPTVDVQVRGKHYTLQVKCFSIKESIFPGVELALEDLAPLHVLVVERMKTQWLKSFAST